MQKFTFSVSFSLLACLINILTGLIMPSWYKNIHVLYIPIFYYSTSTSVISEYLTWSARGQFQAQVLLLLSPAFCESGGHSNSLVCPSICLSVCHKNFNLAHIFWSINDRALILGMHDHCGKPFLLVQWGDLDLWPISRSNLLKGGGLQFLEFACCFKYCLSSASDLPECEIRKRWCTTTMTLSLTT